jgi:phosphohistidine phosphatase SixA
VIVFVLRHADKKRQPPGVDDLTPKGLARATVLARMLAESGVSVAYCRNAVRAQRTLRPLKDRLSAALETIEVAIDASRPEQHVNAIVEAVKALAADKVVVVVTHSTTVSPIIEGLGGEAVGELDDRVFDQLFVLAREPAAKPTLLRLRYGEPTPPA